MARFYPWILAIALALVVPALFAPAVSAAAPELGVSIKHLSSTNAEEEVGDFRAIAPSVPTVMTSIRWFETQRNCRMIRRGEYRWRKLNRVAELWQEEGVKLVGVLKNGPPCTYSEPRSGRSFKTQPRPRFMDDWVEFARKVAERYGPAAGGPLTHVEVWSEPNLKTWTTGPAGYAKAFVRVAKAITQGDPLIEVITGGVGFCCDPAEFIKRMLGSGSLRAHADAIGVHTYRPTVQMALRELGRIRALIGDRRLWITEHAWSTCPSPRLDRTGKCVTRAQQADLLAEYVAALQADVELAVERFYWFSSQDFATEASAADCRGAHNNFYGFWTKPGNPKPSVAVWEALTGVDLDETIPPYPTVRPCPRR